MYCIPPTPHTPHPNPASCVLLPASCFLLPASCFHNCNLAITRCFGPTRAGPYLPPLTRPLIRVRSFAFAHSRSHIRVRSLAPLPRPTLPPPLLSSPRSRRSPQVGEEEEAARGEARVQAEHPGRAAPGRRGTGARGRGGRGDGDAFSGSVERQFGDRARKEQ